MGFKRGDANCLEVVRRAGRLLVAVTVIGELLAGFACGDREPRKREELSLFLASPRVACPPVSTDTVDAHFQQVEGLHVIRCWQEALP